MDHWKSAADVANQPVRETQVRVSVWEAPPQRSDEANYHLKTAWKNVRKNAKVTGRWRDNRHTLITDLAESGAGDQTIMDIAGHVSKRMLRHYSHIQMEAKRTALESIYRHPPQP